MEEQETTSNKQVPQRDDHGRLLPGNTANPNGRPIGSKGFHTLFEAAIKKIAEDKNLPIDDPERQMVTKAIIEALKGNYSYFKDLMDRRYGKPVQPLLHEGEITAKIISVDE